MLSIIMPVFNTADYLTATVKSVLAQTYRDFELILVDDGSTDGSGDICDQLAASDGRVRVIHKLNGGVASARNVGLDEVRGEYIGWVDSDDLISPVMMETMLELAQKYQADIVQCSHVRKVEALATEFLVDIEPTEILDGVGGLKRIYSSHYTNSLSLCTKVYRAGIFDGIRFTEGTAFEDDEIVPQLLERSNVSVFVEMPLYCYVKRQSSIITAPKVQNIMALTDHLENRMLRFKLLDRELYELSRDHFLRYLKGKTIEEVFLNTAVQEQAISLLLKYNKVFRKKANRYDRTALLLLRMGKWGRKIVISTGFEPLQSLFRKIKGVD